MPKDTSLAYHLKRAMDDIRQRVVEEPTYGRVVTDGGQQSQERPLTLDSLWGPPADPQRVRSPDRAEDLER